MSGGAMQAGYTVSIVEDEEVLREELAFQLRHHGFEVETFEDAAGFYRQLAVRRRTIAVLDIGLQGEDGLSVCRHLRRHDAQLGIVLVTARSLREQRLEGLAAGADAYLLKPVDLDELVLVLNRLAQRFEAPRTPAPAAPEARDDASGWVLDLARSALVAPNGIAKRISHSERLLLSALAQAAEPRTHVELAAALGLHPDDFDKHRIEVIVSRLRSSVQRETGAALPLSSVRGVGYALANCRIA